MESAVSGARQDDIRMAVDEALGGVALDEIVRGRAVGSSPTIRAPLATTRRGWRRCALCSRKRSAMILASWW